MLRTVAVAIALGAILIVIARRFNIPAIVLLLVAGVMLGQDFWRQVFDLPAPVQPDKLGDGLLVIVSLSIGLILFEGGLTLDMDEYRGAGPMIKRLLSLGVLVTWFGTAGILMGAAWLFGEDLGRTDAILAGALVIVTGPTVIAPLLKRIKVQPKLHTILHWEGVLIDPLGVFIVLLCYELFVGEQGELAFLNFAIRVGFGIITGIVGGLVLAFIIRKKMVQEELINVFALGMAVLVFGLAEAARTETGLLAVTVAGFVFGLTGSSKMKQIKTFKAELTDLLIGTLFILLAARLEFAQFKALGWAGLLTVFAVFLLLRPLSIFLCSIGLELNLRQKLFLSWIGPRGIVAASMASLIAIRLDDPFVETFTYSVIIATIVLQGSTADLAARLLKVKRRNPTGWLIIGATGFARRVAELLSRLGKVPVVMVDSNARAVREASTSGLHAIAGDARDITLLDQHPQLQVIGYVLAITDNEDLNVRVCQSWAAVVGPDHTFRCDPSESDMVGDRTDSDDETGRLVWPRLPRPSLLSREIDDGDAEVINTTDLRSIRDRNAVPLFLIDDGTISIDPEIDPGDDGEGESEAEAICLIRKADYLLRAIRPELIFSSTAGSLADLIGETIDRVVRFHPALNRDETVADLVERETVFPTVLGNGVAVPHTYSGAIEHRVCALARVPQGVLFGSDTVDLVFLILSPQGDPEGHLATLAEIARLVIRPHVREGLRSAGTPLEVVRLMREQGGR